MEPLLSVEQFEARKGRSYSGIKLVQVTELLDDASALVRRIARSGEKIDGDPVATLDDVDYTNVPPEIKPVVFNMVNRALTNPMGYKSERIGDYQYNDPEAGKIYATAEEEKIILGAVDRSIIGHITLVGDMPERLLVEADVAFPIKAGEDY